MGMIGHITAACAVMLFQCDVMMCAVVITSLAIQQGMKGGTLML